jgi:hypothetical protein
MFHITRFENWDAMAGATYSPELLRIDHRQLALHAPDAHLRAVRDGTVEACCSLWWRNTPEIPEDVLAQVGLVGHYETANSEASMALLDRACAELAGQGCTIAIGPMDGNTWRRYRLLTERGAEPPFFMEPDNPDEWPHWFREAGFEDYALYFSALCTELSYADPRLERVLPRMERAGVTIRAINPARFEDELRAIHALSLISFRDNLLYSPISEEEFVEQYRPVRSVVRPELVLLAEQGRRLVGFLFAIPDLLQAKRGLPIDTIVVKTAAILPGREYAGLGALLVARVHAVALSLGYRRAIHALMHESNESLNVSGHYAAPFRRYALFSKSLRGQEQ